MRTSWIVIFALACKGGGAEDTGATATTPSTTDSGTPSTDTEPPAVCGDEVVEGSEQCDDGNSVGGDGCTPTCTSEDGTLEIEPNDGPEDATPLVAPASGHGWLWAGDRDCFGVEVADNGAVQAVVTREGGCTPEVITQLVDAEDGRIVTGLPSGDGCGTLDPETDTFARYLAAGSYAVCVEATFGDVLDVYQVDVTLFDSCTDLGPLTPDPTQDKDLDGTADACDPDDDQDGVDDAVDNCPETPNGLGMDYDFSTWDDGRIRQWLVLGPYTSGVTPGGCEPSLDSFAAEDDASAAPALGDVVDGTSWVAHLAPATASATVDFLQYFSPGEPREAYVTTWFELPEARELELTIGSDDGNRIWLDGVQIAAEAGCQGVYEDGWVYPLELDAGWHRLLVKVYDGGGGWGVTARLRYPDDSPMTDVPVSLSGPQLWADDQGDLDGDGIGDVCDDTPAG